MPLTVFSMIVPEPTFTNTCPREAVKVKVLPFMAARVPLTRCSKFGADVAGVAVGDAAGEDVDEHAAVITTSVIIAITANP